MDYRMGGAPLGSGTPTSALDTPFGAQYQNLSIKQEENADMFGYEVKKEDLIDYGLDTQMYDFEAPVFGFGASQAAANPQIPIAPQASPHLTQMAPQMSPHATSQLSPHAHPQMGAQIPMTQLASRIGAVPMSAAHLSPQEAENGLPMNPQIASHVAPHAAQMSPHMSPGNRALLQKTDLQVPQKDLLRDTKYALLNVQGRFSQLQAQGFQMDRKQVGSIVRPAPVIQLVGQDQIASRGQEQVVPAGQVVGLAANPAVSTSPVLMANSAASMTVQTQDSPRVSPALRSPAYFPNSPDFKRPITPLNRLRTPLQTASPRRKWREEELVTMTRLAQDAATMPMGDLAAAIRTAERGGEVAPILEPLAPGAGGKYERFHHLFGLVWISTFCEWLPANIEPRSHIYARYVAMCAAHTLTPLTSASLGKLVHLWFPNIKTRRLGTRGRSKYHYCGIKLLGEPGRTLELPVDGESPRVRTPSFGSPAVASAASTPFSVGQTQALFATSTMRYVPGLFASLESSGVADLDKPLSLPVLSQYLPPRFDDADTAETLSSLYQVHCNAVFECVRYMQVDKLFALLPQFACAFTSPLFKLLLAEETLEWVHECDAAMYRTVLRMLARLHLQVVPVEIMTPLRAIANEYVANLAHALTPKFPPPFVHTRLAAARRFVRLLERLVRCIDFGAEAALVLERDRRVLVSEWRRLDHRGIVRSEAPCHGENEDLITVLLALLIPRLLEEDGVTLASLSGFIDELPGRFPKANPWLFTLVALNILTACMRHMSIDAEGFRPWWRLRSWVDEHVAWGFELGGFLYDEYDRILDEE